MGMGGTGTGAAAPTNTAPQGQATSLGFAPAPPGTAIMDNPFAAYNPTSAAGNSGIFSGGTPAPGQMNFQVTDAQKANLLAQQNAQQQQAPRPTYQPQQRAPQYQQYQPQQRAPQYQQQMPSYQSGLQAALMNMMQQYSRPAMRAPMQQGLSPYNYAMNYRPPAINNSSHVAPSVEMQKKQAAEEEAKKQTQQFRFGNIYQEPSSSGGGSA